MTNIDLVSGLDLVKFFLRSKLVLLPYVAGERIGLFDAVALNLDWLRSLPFAELRNLQEKMEAPLKRNGWEATWLRLSDHHYSGVILSGFGVSFAFLLDSWTAFLNADILNAMAQGEASSFLSRLFISDWILVCFLALLEKIEKSEEREDQQFYELVHDAGLLALGLERGLWPPPQKVVEIAEKYRLPAIDDLEAKARLFLKYGYKLLTLKVRQNIPVIFLGEGVSDAEVLAQMEIWRHRQGRETSFEHLYGYLHKYWSDDALVQDLAASLLEEWTTPQSRFSFRSCCKILARQKRERRREWIVEDVENVKPGKVWLQFPCSLGTAALYLASMVDYPAEEGQEPEQLITFWLYHRLKNGEIEGYTATALVTDDGFAKQRGTYLLDEAGFQKALQLLQSWVEEEKARRRHTQVVNCIMEIRKVGRRAAERWLKRRLDADKSWKEIYAELMRQKEEEEA